MSETAEALITPELIAESMSYQEYRSMIDGLLEEDKTTGTNHSEAMIGYTRMNVHRMNRLDKQVQLSAPLKEALKAVDDSWIWLVLTEAWCGDAAQNIPPVARMAEQNDNIALRLILRDENLDIMDEYLTNGGRSIPKLVCLDADTLEEIGTWGPRPATAQSMIQQMKQEEDPDKKEWVKKIQKWYAKNRTEELQSEFTALVKEWS
ncbi:thioredoxin family protein [Fodinibius sediminis]|uniref:Thioredoxin n=1 Tax=Fodinibius sediminis TaxID=1214077 RepID=A0A521F4P3_9BACT|nr:thioredoxin family protein [Fodinibius sediminis]SMO91135.1 Thioredoxin [Fodinibius sediminis]